MKKSLIALALFALASIAMAHGPPSVIDPSVVSQVSISPSIGGGSGDTSSHGGGAGGIKASWIPEGNGNDGITSVPTTQGAPPGDVSPISI